MISFLLYVRFYKIKISRWLYYRKINALTFVSIKPLDVGGYNKKFIATDGKGRKWLIKLCHTSSNRVPDICEREELSYCFGKLFGIPIIRAAVIPIPRELRSLAEQDPDFVQNKCVIFPYLETRSIAKYENEASCLARFSGVIASMAVFYHWFGDEDRGLDDVLLSSENKQLMFIDHGLSGPGNDSRLRSAHPIARGYDDVALINKCWPEKRPSFVSFAKSNIGVDFATGTSKAIMSEITNTPDRLIDKMVDMIDIQDKENYRRKLKERRDSLNEDYARWVGELTLI